jgi:two-component system, NarL family, nitrate/nitrite response regulator NarL
VLYQVRMYPVPMVMMQPSAFGGKRHVLFLFVTTKFWLFNNSPYTSYFVFLQKPIAMSIENLRTEISIVIADDHLLFADGLCLLLRQHTCLNVLATVINARELLSILDRIQADVILLDINMPGMNGVDALRHIRQRTKVPKIIMLSTYNEKILIDQTRKAAADGYLVKTFGPQDLIEAIYIVMAGGQYFPKPIESTSRKTVEEDGFLKQFNLTKREKEIIGFIRDSLTNQQISQRLFLSVYTVDTHRKNIMQKLGLKSPGALIRFIMEHNL